MPKNRKIPRMQKVASQRKIVTLRKRIRDVYASGKLDTVCCRQCGCCRVMCPQMKYCEADSIIDRVWNEWDRADKKNLLVTSVRYFFSDSLIKPCMLLKGAECRVYEDRPLNCRMYGLWTEEEYAQRVYHFMQSADLPREKIPLNTQCPNVRRAKVECPKCRGDGETATDSAECPVCHGSGKADPGPLLPGEVDKLFNALDGLDAVLGMSEMKIKSGWTYRTLHDWVLVKFWGEDTLVQWTNMLISNSQEERNEILKVFEDLAENIL